MQMFINGKKCDSSTGKTMEVVNPANMQVIDTVPVASEEDVKLAIVSAREGFTQWKEVPLYKRIAILTEMRQKLFAHVDELAEILQKETGKLARSARLEILGALSSMDPLFDYARTVGGMCTPVENRFGTDHSMAVTVRMPLGVVVGVVPFNYPVFSLVQKAVPALLMGNAVILKPSSDTPLADLRFVELMVEYGIPAQAVQIVTGRGSEIGKWLIDDDGVDCVMLTGSTDAGIEISKNSAPHLHRVRMELGGNDAFIVLKDADLDAAVNDAVNGRLSNAGQICTAGKRFIVHNSVKATFVEKLVAILAAKKLGDPLDETTDVGPVVSQRAAITIEKQIAHAVEQGAKVVLGGHRVNECYIEPTVMEVTKECDVIHSDEIFGPVWSVIGYDTIEEAIAIANDSKYGLSSSVQGKDMKELLQVARGIVTGTCVINGPGNYGINDAPFGGVKQSGLGDGGGRFSLEDLTELKTIIFKGMF